MNVTRENIMDVLRTIPDPEMPISIVDLGLVEDIRIQPPMALADSARIEIDLLPTFIGCPALDMIAADVRAKVSAIPNVEEVRVNWIFDPAWSVDRITAAGRESLREHGVTVPSRGGATLRDSSQLVTLRVTSSQMVPCPFCGSSSTHLDSPFGPTRCRTIYYCQSCRNSFEHLKRV